MFDVKREKLNQYLCLAIASALGCSFWSHLGAKELSEPITGSYHASQPGENLIAANGMVFEHGNSFGEPPQKIAGSFGMLLANVGNAYQLDLNGNFSNSVYYDGCSHYELERDPNYR